MEDQILLQRLNKAQETFLSQKTSWKHQAIRMMRLFSPANAQATKGNQDKGTKYDFDCRWLVPNTGVIFPGWLLRMSSEMT